MSPEHPNSLAHVHAAAVSSPRPRVLAIDSDPEVHRLLKTSLRGERVEVHGAVSGEKGLRIALTLQPDVILLDMTMADGDGFALLETLKNTAATHDIPVIFLAHTADKELVVRGLDMGAIDFVSKPFDIGELKARVRSALRIRSLIRMLAQRAQIDGLTGLWNRAHFDQRLQEEVITARRHNTPLALMMCDVDEFKPVNDLHGHTLGDHVLEDTARVLAGGRAGDIPCRYGGEEFAIILPHTTAAEAVVLAERMREGIAALRCESVPDLRVTASFGVAELPVPSISAAAPAAHASSPATPEQLARALVEHADAALYSAKRAGRNRVHVANQPRDPVRASA